MRTHRVAALSALLVAAACSKPALTPIKPVPPAPAPPAAPPAEPVEESTVPKDLPAFGATPDADPAKAIELLQEVDMMLSQGAGEATPGDDQWNQVLLAVTTDPGSARARVALAQMVNDDAFTAAQLEPLVTAADCADCADALLNINVEQWPAAAPIVEKVTVSPQRRAIDALRGFPDGGDKATIAAFFKGKKLALTTDCLSCELSGEGSRGGIRKSTGAKALAMLVGLQKDDQFYAMSGWYCAKDCCTATDPFNGTPNGHTFLSSVCFAPGTDQITALTLID